MAYYNNNNRNNNGNNYNKNRNRNNRNRNRRNQPALIKQEREEVMLFNEVTDKLTGRESAEDIMMYLKFNNQDFTSLYELPAVQSSREQKEKLYRIMDSKEFAKALKVCAKEEYLDDGWVSLANDYIIHFAAKQSWFDKEDPESDKRVKHYIYVVERLGGKLANAIADVTNAPYDLAMQLLTIVPKVPNEDEIKFKVYPIINTIDTFVANQTEEEFSESEYTRKQFRKLFKTLFDADDQVEVAMRILLQKKSMSRANLNKHNVYDLVTATALDMLERGSVNDIKEALYTYVNTRRNEEQQNVAPRRVNFHELLDYPNIQEAVGRVIQQRRDGERYLA